MIIISACLTGVACRYDGDHKLRVDLKELLDSGQAMAVCPEELGGLPTPRDPAEYQDGRYLTKRGGDVTEAFHAGAQKAWQQVSLHEINKAILKSKSPMCGCGEIYDGSFQGKTCEGDGEFTKLLKQKGIQVEARD